MCSSYSASGGRLTCQCVQEFWHTLRYNLHAAWRHWDCQRRWNRPGDQLCACNCDVLRSRRPSSSERCKQVASCNASRPAAERGADSQSHDDSRWGLSEVHRRRRPELVGQRGDDLRSSRTPLAKYEHAGVHGRQALLRSADGMFVGLLTVHTNKDQSSGGQRWCPQLPCSQQGCCSKRQLGQRRRTAVLYLQTRADLSCTVRSLQQRCSGAVMHSGDMAVVDS